MAVRLSTEILGKIAELGRKVIDDDGTDLDHAEDLALWLGKQHPIVVRELVADWGRKQIRGWIFRQTRENLSDPNPREEQQSLPFPELRPHLETAPGVLKHQRVMTGPDWDAALAIYRNRRDQAEISLRQLERRYNQIRPHLKGELTTADVLDQVERGEGAAAAE